MSTLNATVASLSDIAKRLDPDGKIAAIVELLAQTNQILDDMLWMEGNLPTGHLTTVRTGLPTVAWRLLNGGTITSKSRTAQITEHAGILEAWSEVDVDLASLNGNTPQWRLSEAMAFIEAMSQEMASTVIYGNAGTAPEEFTGLAARYSAISGATNASNVIDGGGTGSDNASIFLCGWGANSLFGIYPKGSKAGLQHNDYGEQTIENAGGVTGARLRVLQERFQWKAGIALKDWRYCVRICNLDISNLVAESSAADLVKLLIKAVHRIPNLAAVRPAIYVNRTIAEMLDIQRRSAVSTGGGLTYENVDGKNIMTFRGIPIRTVDALLETETRVT